MNIVIKYNGSILSSFILSAHECTHIMLSLRYLSFLNFVNVEKIYLLVSNIYGTAAN